MSTVPATEDSIQDTARSIFAAMAGEKPGRLSRERLQGEVMEWAMADERLKVEMLRFVDVFPTLRSRAEIARHLREYFAREGVAAPAALRWGISLTGQRSPVAPLASAVIRSQMKGFAQRFIVGRDARGAIPALRALRRDGIGFTLDVLGEATVSEAEGLAYQRTYLDLLDGLAAEAASWPRVAVIDEAAWGPLPRVNLSLKITSLYSQIDPVDFDGSVAAVKDLLRPVFRKAIATGAALTLDLEQFRYRDLTLAVFTSLLDEDEFRDYPDAGIVLQAYLRDADRDLARLVTWARERGRPFNLRLVKGAYWDYETVIAAQEGWPVPVFTHKPDTDAMYERLTRVMLRRRTSSGRRSPATTSAPWRPPWRRLGGSGCAQTPSNSRCSTGWATRSRRPSAGWACACASTRPSASSSPAWRTWCAGCSRTRPTTRSCGRRSSRGRPSTSSCRPPETSADFGARAAAAARGRRRPTRGRRVRSATIRTPTSRAARTARRTTRRWPPRAAVSAPTTRCASAAGTSRRRARWSR